MNRWVACLGRLPRQPPFKVKKGGIFQLLMGLHGSKGCLIHTTGKLKSFVTHVDPSGAGKYRLIASTIQEGRTLQFPFPNLPYFQRQYCLYAAYELLE